MKIILLQNIKSLGPKGTIKEVSDGYALNFLLPQKLAMAANQNKILIAEQQKKSLVLKKEKNLEATEEIIKKISGKKIPLGIKKQASVKGKLFAGVSAEDISAALKKSFNLNLAPEKIKLTSHLKEIGEHQLEVILAGHKIILTVAVATSA